MCVCSGCGKLIESNFYYCPWCGYSRVEQSKTDSENLRDQQSKARQAQSRAVSLEKMEAQLDELEKELSMMVLSAQMAR